MTDQTNSAPPLATVREARPLTPAAKRALDEAATRRLEPRPEPGPQPEVGGQQGPEPTRFGDWEKGGIATDF
jgi:hypothetical protein